MLVKDHNGRFRWININDKNDIDLVINYPLKVNVWACIKIDGPNRIHIFENTMDAEMYLEILCCNILDLFIDNNNLISQYDNDSKHTSKLVGNIPE